MPEKGFTLIMDDFPVLGSVNSESNTRRGDYLQHSIALDKVWLQLCLFGL
jgi:hypothetical protein